ncbi:MAG: gliding motility-associated C-terminal domain-containing protein, partial [Mucilaginibacter sp.]|uniref:gliding motility-associated C-terminal domain-containing protein n=1 Tax=Mucilaginibacter sp. TaxID=1882438 RepID=UPI003264DB33
GVINNFNLSGTAGKVALVNNGTIIAAKPTLPTASIIDLVAFGTTAAYWEGSGPAVAPSTTTSIERKASSTSTTVTMTVGGADELKGNGFDDDDNANDFFVPAVINPQNAASAFEPGFTPTYTATPTTLTFSQNINTTSAGVAVTLNGSGTLPATSVGTSGPYLISKTSTGGYTNTLSFTATEMAATTKPVVYVQFTPTALGAANSSLYISGVGAAQQIIPLNGTGTAQPVPTLTTTPSTLTFSAFVGVVAPVQSYTLSGTNITQSTNLTATGPYLISKDNITFASTVSFATTELNAAQTPTVYVQFKPTVVGASNGTVVQTTTGGGTVSATVTLNGTGITPPNVAPTLDAIADQNICAVTTPAIIGLTGITVGPSSETASQAITSLSVTSNNTALFASLGVTPVIGGASTLNYAIANGQTGTAIVTVTVKDNGGVLNGGVDTYTRTFNVTVNALAQITITSDAYNNIIEKGGVATLIANGGTTYAWTSNASITSSLTTPNLTIRPTATTTYTVAATNASGCVTTQTITITVRNAAKLETGNVLTPNGDGKNDYWVIRNIDLYSGNTVKVFDKTGKMIFTKTGYNNDWNGYYNGQPLPQGTYYYVVDLGVGLPYRGTLSVVRD